MYFDKTMATSFYIGGPLFYLIVFALNLTLLRHGYAVDFACMLEL